MPTPNHDDLTPEQRARKVIDAQLGEAGWTVAAPGTAVTATPTARCELSGDTARAGSPDDQTANCGG